MKPIANLFAVQLSELKFYQYVSLNKHTENFDAIIIGGSYAGLSAAMALGRSQRNVLIIDSGIAANKQDVIIHNFITHDEESAAVILTKAKEQVLRYKTVSFLKDKAEKIFYHSEKFNVQTRRNEKFTSKKILFAAGINDMLPNIPGFESCWGISIFHYPYYSGYEVLNTDIGIIANGDDAFEIIKQIHNLNKHLLLFTNGASTLSSEQVNKIEEKNILIIEEKIITIDHKKGQVKNIILKDKCTYSVNAIFCKLPFVQATDIPKNQLGCEFTAEGLIKTDLLQKTSVHGVYAAGDCTCIFRAISVSAASGSIAGACINKEISEETF